MASQRTDLSERLEALIAHSPDIVVATDKSGTIIFYNDGASATLGYSTEEILGQPVTTVYPSRDEARRVMKVMRGPEGGGAGVVTNLPTHFQAKNGDEIPVAISGTLVLDAEGKEDGTIGFAKDLREILHNEEQAVLGQVAVGLAHEIRNPLAVVVNQAELLEGELYDLAGERDCSVENERIDAIRREVARISEIVEQLGEMARTDSYETVDYVGPSRMVDLRKVREPGGDPRLKGLRILVCDDDGGICRSLGEILEADGCIVDTASDGQEALDRIRANPGIITSESITGRIIRLSHWLPNQPQPAHTDDERIRLFQNYGRAIAQFHQALATYEDDHILERTWQASLHSRVIDQAIPTIFVYLDDAKHTWFQNLRATIEVDMITAFANLPEQLVIWDCHPGNVARDGFEVTGFVDCNHIAIAPRIFDLSNFLVNLLKWDVNDTEKSARWLAHFDQLIVGYEQVQPLTSSEKQGLFYGLIGVTLTMIDFFFQTDRPALTELEFDTVEWLVQHRSAICDQLEM